MAKKEKENTAICNKEICMCLLWSENIFPLNPNSIQQLSNFWSKILILIVFFVKSNHACCGGIIDSAT